MADGWGDDWGETDTKNVPAAPQNSNYDRQNMNNSFDKRDNRNNDRSNRGRGHGSSWNRDNNRGRVFTNRDRDGQGRDGYNRGGRGRDNNYDRGNQSFERKRTYDDNGGGSSNSLSETVEVNPNKIGCIIGKSGTKIREIQSDNNCTVKIDRENTTIDGKSVVTISGNNADDLANAKSIIMELTKDHAHEYYDKKESGTLEKFEPPPVQLIDWDNVNKEYEEQRKIRWAKLPKLRKNFYEEDPSIARMLPEEVQSIRKANNDTTVRRVFEENAQASAPIPNPCTSFAQCFGKYPDLMEELRKQGFEKPSPIQAQAWPILLKGEDLIGIAQTGTGKTLAFLLPAMIHTEYQEIPRRERGGPNVLILAPTRELALQIRDEVAKYNFRGMKAVCIYGGGDRKDQISKVEKGVEIVIATPGRLNDLVEAKVIDVTTITYLVLDEADRMLDMGFEPQIRKFLLDIRPDRQTVMTSATWPPGVRRLAQSYMENPIQVFVGSLNLSAVHTVKQEIEILDEEDKFSRIIDFVKNMQEHEKAIIFCGRKTRCDHLASEMTLQGCYNQCIHGDREQSDREQALSDIKNGEIRILIATDVASRGLDIDDITHVINYDFPHNIEEYVHRVGRTGRAGRLGTSISFFTRENWNMAGELIPILSEAMQHIPDEVTEMAERFEKMKQRRALEMGGSDRSGGRGGGGRGFGDRRGGGGRPRW